MIDWKETIVPLRTHMIPIRLMISNLSSNKLKRTQNMKIVKELKALRQDSYVLFLLF